MTRGQSSTKLVSKSYVAEAGNRLRMESAPQLQSGGSFLQHLPWRRETQGYPTEADGKRTFPVGRILLTPLCLALLSGFEVPE